MSQFWSFDKSLVSPLIVMVREVGTTPHSRTAFSASVTKFSSAHRTRDTIGFVGSVSSTDMFVPATTESTVQVPSVGRFADGTFPSAHNGA